MVENEAYQQWNEEQEAAFVAWATRVAYEPEAVVAEIDGQLKHVVRRANNELTVPAMEACKEINRIPDLQFNIQELARSSEPAHQASINTIIEAIPELIQEDADAHGGTPLIVSQAVDMRVATFLGEDFLLFRSIDHMTLKKAREIVAIVRASSPEERVRIVETVLSGNLRDAHFTVTHADATFDNMKADFWKDFDDFKADLEARNTAFFAKLDERTGYGRILQEFQVSQREGNKKDRIDKLTLRAVKQHIKNYRHEHPVSALPYYCSGTDVDGMTMQELYDFELKQCPDAPIVFDILARRVDSWRELERQGALGGFYGIIRYLGDRTLSPSTTLGKLAQRRIDLYKHFHPDSADRLSDATDPITDEEHRYMDSINIFLDWLKGLQTSGRIKSNT